MRLSGLSRALVVVTVCLGLTAACSSKAALTTQPPGTATRAGAVTPAPATDTCTPVADVDRLQPASGAWFGVNLDWGHDTLADYARRLGHAPAVAVSFAPLPLGPSAADVDAAVDQVAAVHGALMLTLEPNDGLGAVTPDVVHDLADRLARYNARGVPVFLRFAHEMNGSWYVWGQQPTGYVKAFRAVADAVHRSAPLTAMVWAPNYGGGYPFTGGKYAARPGSADFGRLDTNHDGRLTMSDDPYAPYYPGDDAVDWVGMSIYHWGAHYPWGRNELPEPGSFVAMLTGSYHGTVGDQRALPDFHAFAVAHHRPLALTETAAFYAPGRGGDAMAIKQAWWRQVFAAVDSATLPQLKMVNWFEWDKHEVEVDARVDWTATEDARQAAGFAGDLARTLRYADSMDFCAPHPPR